ncbi:MAG: hypothetical protein RBR86_03495 [Pseudobdellovibrionaceae bacterium]|nr:hypothetical protein [Pseudobdellovibrionaceae bacterium]
MIIRLFVYISSHINRFATFGRRCFFLKFGLDELNMKFDRDGNVHTAYSLRHTYICLCLMEGADIYQIAKNCRASVEMIEKYYAAHLNNTLDTSAINVRKSVKKSKKTDKSELEI